MSYEFRSPNVSGQTPEAQLQQLLSFLRQHIQQLNWVLQDMEGKEAANLTQEQQRAVIEAAGQSAELFQTFYRKLRKKQAQENFVGAARKTILENGSWAQGVSAAADMEAVGRYSLFIVVTGGVPVVCARNGSAICGSGAVLTCGTNALTVTTASSPVTAVYAII